MQLKPLDSSWAMEQIRRDRQAVEDYRRILAIHKVPVMAVIYEDFFQEHASDGHHLDQVNAVLRFLQYDPINAELFQNHWKHNFNNRNDRFSSSEAYRLIPGIERIEEEVGSTEYGWLFR